MGVKLSVVLVEDEKGVPYYGIRRASDQKLIPNVGFYSEEHGRVQAAAYAAGWLDAGGAW